MVELVHIVGAGLDIASTAFETQSSNKMYLTAYSPPNHDAPLATFKGIHSKDDRRYLAAFYDKAPS